MADDEYDEIGMKLMTILSAFSGEDEADAAETLADSLSDQRVDEGAGR